MFLRFDIGHTRCQTLQLVGQPVGVQLENLFPTGASLVIQQGQKLFQRESLGIGPPVGVSFVRKCLVESPGHSLGQSKFVWSHLLDSLDCQNDVIHPSLLI